MRKSIVITALFLSSFTIVAQDARAILKKTYEKCQSIQNGTYEMTRHMKFMSSTDTVISSIQGSFKKLPDDTIHKAVFHYRHFRNNEFTGEILYTGEDFVTANALDSTATIMSKSLWAKEIKANSRQQKFYSPLMHSNSSPLPRDSDFIDTNYVFKFIGEEIINSITCYHIQQNETPEFKNSEMMKPLRTELHFWINKSDMIPIKYSIAHDVVMNNDTMYQYEVNTLNKYELNNLMDEHMFTLKSIPGFYKLKDYAPFNKPASLPKDTLAPNWELMSIKGEKISLSSLKGSLVLVDFFYKACYPCMLALPHLQSLNEKYHDKGLKVIGIDPFDKIEDGIGSFLEKRGVTYEVLLGGKDVAADYRVSAYPTMYLIDRNGKVIFMLEGFGKDMENALDE